LNKSTYLTVNTIQKTLLGRANPYRIRDWFYLFTGSNDVKAYVIIHS